MLDGAFISHLFLWAIGGLSVVGAALTAMCVWSLGRAAYRRD
jgi:hypothetical protein